jgi:hypothetical protein
MKISLNILLTASAVALLLSGCAQKVRIKALDPAEVGAMASKKKIAILYSRRNPAAKSLQSRH